MRLQFLENVKVDATCESVRKLVKFAEQPVFDEIRPDTCYSETGNHPGDAYNNGIGDGEILMAREVLDALGIDYIVDIEDE